MTTDVQKLDELIRFGADGARDFHELLVSVTSNGQPLYVFIGFGDD